MSLRAYAEINLHITWHVKDNNPILSDMIEVQTHRFLRGRVMGTPGAVFHEVGGTDDHIHLVASLPPDELISGWIGKLKGAPAAISSTTRSPTASYSTGRPDTVWWCLARRIFRG